MITKIIVCEIDSNKHRIKEYVISSIFFQSTNEKSQQIKACFRKKIHLISDLKTDVLIKIDIFTFENFILNFKKK